MGIETKVKSRIDREMQQLKEMQEKHDNCQHRYAYCISDAHTREDIWYCNDLCKKFLGCQKPPGAIAVSPPESMEWDEP